MCIGRTKSQYKNIQEIIPWNTFLKITNTLITPMATHNLEITNPPPKTLQKLQKCLNQQIRYIQPFRNVANITLLHITGSSRLELTAAKQRVLFWNSIVTRNDTIGRTIKKWTNINDHNMRNDLLQTLKILDWDS
jgi:hypothetical protein